MKDIYLKLYEDILLTVETLTWKWNKSMAFNTFKLYQKESLTYM
jgi:hypothetical protein